MYVVKKKEKKHIEFQCAPLNMDSPIPSWSYFLIIEPIHCYLNLDMTLYFKMPTPATLMYVSVCVCIH